MVGHKLGEFSPTRQFSGHTPADKKAAQEAAEETAALQLHQVHPCCCKPTPAKTKRGN